MEKVTDSAKNRTLFACGKETTNAMVSRITAYSIYSLKPIRKSIYIEYRINRKALTRGRTDTLPTVFLTMTFTFEHDLDTVK